MAIRKLKIIIGISCAIITGFSENLKSRYIADRPYDGSLPIIMSNPIEVVQDVKRNGLIIGVLLYFLLRGETKKGVWGTMYDPTNGEVWPWPQVELKSHKYYVLKPKVLKINIKMLTCDILVSAVDRYNLIVNDLFLISNENNVDYKRSINMKNDDNYKGVLKSLDVELTSECEQYPSLNMDERYHLNISSISNLKSHSIWGILRGLETFSQLFYFTENFSEIRIKSTIIDDYPAYKHRGLLIDTGRHYLSVPVILKMLDAMAINKMNVLHWHIVDDQSFPYESELYPSLSDKGAFYPSLVYHKKDILSIIEYARIRGIRVIPELDVPGHTRSWGNAYPNLIIECYKGFGTMNPTKEEVFIFLKKLYQEIGTLFPDQFLHIGGDEVDLGCWKSDPDVTKYMKDNNMKVKQLYAQFINTTISLLPQKNKPIVWQEVFDEHALIEKTYVQVWKYEYIEEMVNILKAGHYVIFSSSWYLDYLEQGWETFYKADPRQMVFYNSNSQDYLENIVGGEACMWGEMVDNVNVLSRTWPRASAVAERLWTGLNYQQMTKTLNDLAMARHRIEEHVCRMNRRGVPAQPPSGPGFCIGATT